MFLTPVTTTFWCKVTPLGESKHSRDYQTKDTDRLKRHDIDVMVLKVDSQWCYFCVHSEGYFRLILAVSIKTLALLQCCDIDNYTVSGKKEATLFSTTTLAFLGRFLYFLYR